MKKSTLAIAASAALLAGVSAVQIAAQGTADIVLPPNPAMSTPDMFAWDLFTQVVRPTAGGLMFETWASDTDTFGTAATPVFPAQRRAIQPRSGRPTLTMGNDAHGAGAITPSTLHDLAREEVRRNRVTFDYIVQNKLWLVSGLQAAFGKTIDFPVNAVEVKSNWLTFEQLRQYYPRDLTRSEADIRKNFVVVAGSDRKPYALVAMHVISKAVPNWTWATFEHEANPGRCDIIGCVDMFGAEKSVVKPASKADQGYGRCRKTAALLNMMNRRNLAPQFQNYCLKGTQTDYTDDSGLPIRLGNSITEGGFVNSASCMTCHGTAGWDQSGNTSNDTAPIGPPQATFFWSWQVPTHDSLSVTGTAAQQITSADFVWSIPFCAFNDVPNTPNPGAVEGCVTDDR